MSQKIDPKMQLNTTDKIEMKLWCSRADVFLNLLWQVYSLICHLRPRLVVSTKYSIASMQYMQLYIVVSIVSPLPWGEMQLLKG